MDESFDDRSETDINSCSENILEGEEDFVLDLGREMIANVMFYNRASQLVARAPKVAHGALASGARHGKRRKKI